MIKHVIEISGGIFAAVMTFVVCCLCSSPASAIEKMTYVGGLVGANVVSGDSNTSSNANYGVTLGTKVDPSGTIGLGFYGTYAGQNTTTSVFGLPVGTATHDYNLCGELNIFAWVFHLGGDAGAGLTTWDAVAGNDSLGTSNTAFVYGPEAGIDIPLGTSALTIGAEAHYLFSTASGVPNNLQALGALKVWL